MDRCEKELEDPSTSQWRIDELVRKRRKFKDQAWEYETQALIRAEEASTAAAALQDKGEHVYRCRQEVLNII